MDEQQPASAPVPASTALPGIFGTKIPSSVAFGIGILLFFMPFIDIKCNTMILQKVSGVQLATGFEIKGPGSDNSLVGGLESMNHGDNSTIKTGEKNEANIYALVSLIMGAVGLILSLLTGKSATIAGFITGVVAAVALVVTLIDVKNKVKLDLPDKIGKKMAEGVIISVDFTPWFYIAVIAFSAGAWFCYKRMESAKMQ